MIDLARLAEVAAQHVPNGFGVGAADPSAPATALLPPERAATTGMIDTRLREFSAGRAAARQAMATLGLPPAAIPMQGNRAPHWPAGLFGSITHTSHAALAIVARSTAAQSIGIDLEEATPLPQDLWDVVLTPAERARTRDGAIAKRIFSAKEAAYKAQFPITEQPLEFTDMTIKFEGSHMRVHSTHPAVKPLLPKLHAQSIETGLGVYLSLVFISAE
ncbi:4'-phosphopantetheinyl transferase [Tateyamaria sp. syn59]|uniref:4'-phosphopantetheinyl transferase family protein n=1 Tax=Tateyamaria sp. syn59 TaxID=2576942 RepID=UPI0011BDEE20|nr:4'-phosphopantetheinyl transferase superfamily protein [Tateyamaria sp. syn59]